MNYTKEGRESLWYEYLGAKETSYQEVCEWASEHVAGLFDDLDEKDLMLDKFEAQNLTDLSDMAKFVLERDKALAEIDRLTQPPAINGMLEQIKHKQPTDVCELSVWDVQLLIAEIARLKAERDEFLDDSIRWNAECSRLREMLVSEAESSDAVIDRQIARWIYAEEERDKLQSQLIDLTHHLEEARSRINHLENAWDPEGWQFQRDEARTEVKQLREEINRLTFGIRSSLVQYDGISCPDCKRMLRSCQC